MEETILKRKTYFDHDLIDLCAFVGLIIAGFLYILQFVLSLFDINSMGTISNVFGLIRDIAFAVGLGLAGYKFTLGKRAWVKVIFWVALCAYLAFAVLHVIPTKV